MTPKSKHVYTSNKHTMFCLHCLEQLFSFPWLNIKRLVDSHQSESNQLIDAVFYKLTSRKMSRVRASRAWYYKTVSE